MVPEGIRLFLDKTATPNVPMPQQKHE